MTEFWLVRHGQTDWNLEGRFQGQSDAPLNAEGVLQAEELAEKLIKVEVFDGIFASDLQRAYRSAKIIAGRLNLPVQIDRRLREVNQGEWEGMLIRDIVNSYRKTWEKRRTNPETARAPGGESVVEVAARMTEAADEIAALHPNGRVLIVSHGLALATLVCTARQIPLAEVYSHILNNAEPEIIPWKCNGCEEGIGD